jgi:hypothetical protein
MKKVKVVYNACYGGFSLSRKAVEKLIQLGSKEAAAELADHDEAFKDYPALANLGVRLYLDRHDPFLVQVVEELGSEASGDCAHLKIAELSGNKYIIDEYDGFESVSEPDDINWIVAE